MNSRPCDVWNTFVKIQSVGPKAVAPSLALAVNKRRRVKTWILQ